MYKSPDQHRHSPTTSRTQPRQAHHAAPDLLKHDFAEALEKGEVEISAVTIDGREIPYEFRVIDHDDDEGEWYDVQLGAFGYSPIGAIQWGTGRVDWVSAEEREAAVLVAIEATLAWHPAGRGVERGGGRNRSTFKGVQYRLSDFGPYFETAGAGE